MPELSETYTYRSGPWPEPPDITGVLPQLVKHDRFLQLVFVGFANGWKGSDLVGSTYFDDFLRLVDQMRSAFLDELIDFNEAGPVPIWAVRAKEAASEK